MVAVAGGWWDVYKESVARLSFCRGLLASFFVHFGGRGVQHGVHFGRFGGLGASLSALGAQFAPGPPGLFRGRPLFSDFGVQRESKGVPK